MSGGKNRPSGTPRGARRTTAAVLAAVGGVVLATSAAVASPAYADPTPATTLVVNADQILRPVTHVASGSLYGLASDAVPSDSVAAPLKPNTFVQMAPGGQQLPNGEPAPAGDALKVAAKAARLGAKVVVRMPDWYPNFPYRWVSWDDWLHAVDTQVKAVQASGATNIAAYELWNEPDWTWNAAAAGSFNDGWTRTYREVRSLDATTPIQGPSFSNNISGMQSFLQNAVATNTVPDIISWHELAGANLIQPDIAKVTSIERSLGIPSRPIAIEEYGEPSEVGVPGAMVGYIAKFERLGVHDAEIAFWNHYGSLGDTLVDTGGAPNGAYWLYKWYGEMSGNMVDTTPPSQTGLDGAASVTADRKQLDVIFGGGTGSSAVTINGLNDLNFNNDLVNVKLEYTPSLGRTTPVSGPVTISDETYETHKGTITVPVPGMNPAYGYHIVVTPKDQSSTTNLAGKYGITNANSGLAMGATGGSTASGTLVDQTATGSKPQAWTLVQAGSGLYKIVNNASGEVLGIQGQSTDNGAPALIANASKTSDQLWQLIPDGHGRYKIANYNSGKVLGVSGMSTAPGADVVQWTEGQSTACDPNGPRIEGKIGNALKLCGTGEYVNLPASAVDGLSGDYTISAWVNPSEDRTWSRVFDFGTGTTANMFLTMDSGAGPRFALTTGGPGQEQRLSDPQELPLNTWSLITVTVSGGTGTLYVNGQAVASNTQMTLRPSDLGNTTNNWIGRSQYNDPYLDGAVDDLNIYNRALSASEVATLASGQVGQGNVAHYAFDETSGTAIVDSSGNNRDGSIAAIPDSTVTTDPAATLDHLWSLTPTR
jgi:hypothetical protein